MRTIRTYIQLLLIAVASMVMNTALSTNSAAQDNIATQANKVKNSIDTGITYKTAPKSVRAVTEGALMKNVVQFAKNIYDSLEGAAGGGNTLQDVIDNNDTFQTPIIYTGSNVFGMKLFNAGGMTAYIARGTIATRSESGQTSINLLTTSDGTDNRLQYGTSTGNKYLRAPTITGTQIDTLQDGSGTLAYTKDIKNAKVLTMRTISPTFQTVTTYLGGGSLTCIGTTLTGYISGTSGTYVADNDTVFSITLPYTYSAQTSIFLFPLSSAAAKAQVYWLAGNSVPGTSVTYYFKAASNVTSGQGFSFNYLVIGRD